MYETDLTDFQGQVIHETRRSPWQAAHRLVSGVLVSGLTCLYFTLLRVRYVLFEFEAPEALRYEGMVGIVALAW